MSFLQKLNTSQGEQVYLLRGKDSGRDAWYFILVDKMKVPLFKKASKTPQSSFKLNSFGEVLASGWGESPPPNIVDKIKKDYQS